MKTLFKTQVLLFLALVMGFISCSEDETPSSPLDVVSDIVVVENNIGNWDKAYLTPNGYFCYSSDLEKALSESTISRGDATGKLEALNYTSKNGATRATVVMDKESKLPVHIYTDGSVLDFSYLNDSILELVCEQDKEIFMMDSIAYSKEALVSAAYSAGHDNVLQMGLSILVNLVDQHVNDDAKFRSLINDFKSVLGLIYDENNTETSSGVTLPITGGCYDFASESFDWHSEVVEDAYYSIVLWTGKATFKVGGSSCTLAGTVWCASPTYNEYGVYGILCDENPDNLVVGMAEYEGTGVQDDDAMSYEVDFRGFKPNTTYYYRAYYQFNSSDHGNLTLKYAEDGAHVGYDTEIKSFTTGDNILNVDVVMCIDVTGSMYNIISTVKKNAMSFYDLFKERCEMNTIDLASLNIKVVPFRDINVDGSQALLESPTYSMPAQQDEFNSYVGGLYASGGGDWAESGMEALDKAFSNTDWGADDGYHRQVVILWTDAPYLVGSSYTSLTPEMVCDKWNTLPSGRRLILFAPSGSAYEHNAGSWDVLNSWKNTIHDDDLTSGFNNFEYILDAIIGELTGRSIPTRSVTGKMPYAPNVR